VSAAAANVEITSAFAFEPAQITVARGASVTWTNKSNSNHTVTSGAPDQPANTFNHALAPAGTYTVKFDNAGSFDYFCSIHTNMRGAVIVR
jgi:plastocyanin